MASAPSECRPRCAAGCNSQLPFLALTSSSPQVHIPPVQRRRIWSIARTVRAPGRHDARGLRPAAAGRADARADGTRHVGWAPGRGEETRWTGAADIGRVSRGGGRTAHPRMLASLSASPAVLWRSRGFRRARRANRHAGSDHGDSGGSVCEVQSGHCTGYCHASAGSRPAFAQGLRRLRSQQRGHPAPAASSSSAHGTAHAKPGHAVRRAADSVGGSADAATTARVATQTTCLLRAACLSWPN